ncbi:MAG: small subunit ribosomal protein [Chloroflexota bacterium]|nr:small subunit ribosomal protein [Chloroflexota bacterium]
MDQLNGIQATGDNKSDNKEITNMASLLESEGLGLELPQAGEIKTGTIASIAPGQIMVSIGAKSEGIINGQEFELIPPDVFASMEVGQDIPVYVITPEDHNGNLLLSYIRALEAESWEKADEVMKDKETFTGKVVGYNRGGLLVSFDKLRGFVPTSQLSYSRRMELTGDSADKRFGEMIGDEISLQIIEVDQERRRLIFSEKAATHETRDSIRDKVIEKLEVGDVKTGRITSLADFGAFVNINGADGLVHLSEISWDRIRHPGDELKVGQEVQVQVISIDEEKRHIGLSIRRLKDDPWQDQIKSLKVGQLVEAKITRLTKFGAFAMLESGIEGLIHISELADEHIGHPKEILHEGDQVTLRIIKIEPESHRIGLSLRRVESLAFADMDMKMLEKELEDTDIKIDADEPEAKEEPEAKSEPAAEEPEAESENEAPEAEAPTEENTEASGE